MKETVKKISIFLKKVFGYGITICLFAGGLTFFGYAAALILGGETAAVICTLLYKQILPVIIRVSTVLVLMGLLIMYLDGEVALTARKS